jgi:hypothetical protein
LAFANAQADPVSNANANAAFNTILHSAATTCAAAAFPEKG